MFCTLFLLFFTRAYSLPCVYMYFYPFPSWGTYYETLNFELHHRHHTGSDHQQITSGGPAEGVAGSNKMMQL